MEKLTTSKGHENLKNKAKALEKRVRDIQSEIGNATEQSSETWHDNAPYSILVEELKIADRRLNDAIAEINGCRISEYPTKLNELVVKYGTQVVFERNGDEITFSIVGYGDVDIDKGRILYHAPIAQILNGRREGEKFIANLHNEPSKFWIKNVTALGNLT